MSPRWSSFDLDRYQAKRLEGKPGASQQSEEPKTDKESVLHAKIIEECKRKRWVVFHGSMAHKTNRTEGEPDFLIFLPNGASLMVECKTATGKLSEEQTIIHHRLQSLGHVVHVVRSFAQFQEVVRNTQDPKLDAYNGA